MDWTKKKDAILIHDIFELMHYQILNLFMNIFIQMLQFIYLEKKQKFEEIFSFTDAQRL